MKKQGLGRGLSALMAEMGEAGAPVSPTSLPVGLIQPCAGQPRRDFAPEAMAELADSIRSKGVLQPILVRAIDGGKYEIVAGERRWRACQMAGLHEIPVVVRSYSDADSFEVALIENVQRQDLNPLEEALGYQRLVNEYGQTQLMVATLTGKSRSHVANMLRLLDLPQPVLDLLRDGRISVGHAKVILSHPEPAALAALIAAQGLSVRQAEALASRSQPAGRAPREARNSGAIDPEIEALELQLVAATGLRVKIAPDGFGGQITLHYSDFDQLDMILARLQGKAFG